MSAAPRQIDALTGLRGIAAWAVVLFHLRNGMKALVPPEAIATLYYGHLAVDLFFVLSGFVIWLNYAERLRGGGWTAARQFWWRRLARVWPLHALLLAAFVGYAAALTLHGSDTTEFPWAQLPLHLLLVQDWGWANALHWNYPAWSISAELAAYLLFPAVVAARWQHWPTGFLLALAAALAAALYLLFAAFGFARLSEGISELGLWRCLIGFSLGNILGVLWLRRPAAPAWPWGLVCAAWLALAWALDLPPTATVPAALFTGLMALALDRGPCARLLAAPPLRYLGEISYSTYLAHYLLLALFRQVFIDASLQFSWIEVGGYLALVLAVSAVLFRTVEQPAQAWLNRHPPRWAGRTAVPAE